MRICSITLTNIRSYRHQTVEFPDHSAILSGDIGSGKSTILLAIEFALFGLLRGMTDGSTLLRNGEHQGQVSMECIIANKHIVIDRPLQRTKKGIAQSNGRLLIDSIAYDLTPNQMRARILHLLGYPPTTSAKSLIYRYTVFTSQEQMKAIITQDPQVRLDTLRTLFGIDRYKHIVNNTASIMRHIKTMHATLQGQTQPLRTINEQLIATQKLITQTQQDLATQTTQLQQHQAEYDRHTHHIQTKEQQLKQRETQLHKLHTDKQKAQQLTKDIQQLTKTIDTIKESIAQRAQLTPPPQVLDTDITTQQQRIQTIQEHINQKQSLKASIQNLTEQLEKKPTHPDTIRTQIESIQELLKKTTPHPTLRDQAKQKWETTVTQRIRHENILEQLKQQQPITSGVCSLCKQTITHQYAQQHQHDHQKQQQEITSALETLTHQEQQQKQTFEHYATLYEQQQHQQVQYQERIKALQTIYQQALEQTHHYQQLVDRHTQLIKQDAQSPDIETLQNNLKKQQEHITILFNQQKAYEQYTTQRQLLEKEQQLVEQYKHQLEQHKKQLSDIAYSDTTLLDHQHKVTQLIEHIQKDKQHLTAINQQIRHTTGTVSMLQERQQQLTTKLKELEEQKVRLHNIEQRAEYLNAIIQWTKTRFDPLIHNIETQVFMAIYNEFNSLFVRWFDLLIDDPTMTGSLDQEFTPTIQQNGYDIDIVNMSGGERTCVALAYRLALTKVVNDIIHDIHTKDLLILDEPTEGFSTEQLDRVREVLNELHIRQLIIVSHEPKVLSFVQTTLQVTKQEHESTVTQL